MSTYATATCTVPVVHGLCLVMFCFNNIELGLDEHEIIYTVLVLFDQALYVVNFLKLAGYSLDGEGTFVQETAPDY